MAARSRARAEAALATPADPFDAVVGQVGFVVHRRQAAQWAIRNYANAKLDTLAFCEAGRAWYQCRGQHFSAQRGTLLFFPRGLARSGWTDAQDQWSFYSVGFRLTALGREQRQAFNQLPNHLALANVTEILTHFQRLERFWRGWEPGSSMACRGIIANLVQQYVAAAERQRRTIPHVHALEDVVTLLHHNVGHVFSVAELAEQARLSESRFRLLFKRLTGESVTRYQNRLRIQRARDLLVSGQYTVTAVAEELGFRDVYYFSRLFKKITGANPSDFQNH